jgi:hypothetical protein
MDSELTPLTNFNKKDRQNKNRPDTLVTMKHKNVKKLYKNLHLFNCLLVQHTNQHIVHNPVVPKHGALAIKYMAFFWYIFLAG